MVQDANAVVYAYLMEKGYKDIASKFKLKAEKDASGTKQQSANVSQGSDLLQFVKNAGLNVNTVAANHVVGLLYSVVYKYLLVVVLWNEYGG